MFVLVAHYRRHLRSKRHTRNQHACPHCDEVFPSSEALYIHSSRTHLEEEIIYRFYCETCEKPIRRNSDIATHKGRDPDRHVIVERLTRVMRKKKRRIVSIPEPQQVVPERIEDRHLNDLLSGFSAHDDDHSF